jgi:PKHD-type hydroxylase
MILNIANVLSATEAQEAVQSLTAARFEDGRRTAGQHARIVKDNLQAATEDDAAKAVKTLVAGRLMANSLFVLAARPKRLSPILINRYDRGMRYGAHVDDALMGGMRSDVSFTLFLSKPEDYDGGALVIETTAGEERFKLDAGALVLYPATTLHRVEEVTRGTRLAAVGWVESYVRDAEKRALLFDLDSARHALFQEYGKTEAFDLLSKCAANLLRLWAET